MNRLILTLLLCTGFALAAAETDISGVTCTPDGVCYLPGETPEISGAPAAQFTLLRRGIGLMDADRFLEFLQHTPGAVTGEFWAMLALAFVGGILLNLTPCVLPMIPINLAIIGANGGKHGFRRGLLYGTGMCIAYGILGALAAFAGIGFGALNSSPLFNIAIGILFLLMSLAMAGAIRFDLQRFRPDISGKLNRQAWFAPVIFGALAALLAGACVAPAVASVLFYTANAVSNGQYYAAVIPFVLGAGMALPWPIAGAGTAILPKPGRFMNGIKYLFAVIIFASAIYYIVSGIRLASANGNSANDGFAALENARQQALQRKLPILVKFTASWCGNCAAMERGALNDRRVKKVLTDEFITVTFPAEDPREPKIAALLKAWDIPGFPAFVILEPVTSQK